MKKKSLFIDAYLSLALLAEDRFRINPAVILAQSAIESGWGTSVLAVKHNNFFGITGYGKRNEWWDGKTVELGKHSLKFRVYRSAADSFMDYASLIRNSYTRAACVSYDPKAFAEAIAYSPYISEVNGDDRESYKRLLTDISHYVAFQTASRYGA
ncbi:MAG: glucosaminidase domain-containing protein [Tannerellaceae bacterium]|nr:glucosaminidase domain-containing protein [Tannerellaceae bacterium]